MSFVVNNNLAALNAYNNLTVSGNDMNSALEKLSSGLRINRAADDASGLVISEGLRAQIGGLAQAQRNAQDGISVVQTAEGALNETTAILQRIRDLAVQASNTGANDPTSRAAAASEVTQDLAELDRISSSTKFGSRTLLDGTAGSLTFQIGADASSNSQVSVTIGTVTVAGLKLNATTPATAATLTSTSDTSDAALTATPLDYSSGTHTLTVTADGVTKSVTLTKKYDGSTNTQATLKSDLQTALDGQFGAGKVTVGVSGSNLTLADASATGSSSTVSVSGDVAAALFGTAASATGTAGNDIASLISAGDNSAITRIDSAIAQVSSVRGDLGAVQNRFQHAINNMTVTQENLTASESRIRDTDMAQTMTEYTRAQILNQAGTAMLAQANASSQGVLQLLRG